MLLDHLKIQLRQEVLLHSLSLGEERFWKDVFLLEELEDPVAILPARPFRCSPWDIGVWNQAKFGFLGVLFLHWTSQL